VSTSTKRVAASGVFGWVRIAVAATALWALAPSPAARAEEPAAEAHAGEAHAGEGTLRPVEVTAKEFDAEPAGEEHGEHGPEIDGGKIALQFLNFGVLVFILAWFGGRAINKALAARHHQIKTDIASAAEVRAEAETKLKKQEARLASLETEIAELRRGLKAEAEAEKARLIAAAEERVKRIQAETQFLLDQQVREAEGRLRREAAEVALRAAEELLRKSMGPVDQQRLLDTFVADVSQPGRTS
jgi:F-type H+-transporting ATPase subunit b